MPFATYRLPAMKRMLAMKVQMDQRTSQFRLETKLTVATFISLLYQDSHRSMQKTEILNCWFNVIIFLSLCPFITIRLSFLIMPADCIILYIIYGKFSYLCQWFPMALKFGSWPFHGKQILKLQARF